MNLEALSSAPGVEETFDSMSMESEVGGEYTGEAHAERDTIAETREVGRDQKISTDSKMLKASSS